MANVILLNKKNKDKKIFSDFRSDTVTKPTDEMRSAMANAEVGDDVLGDDMTVKKLEKLAADITGKEAALFVPSGTMANELAVKIWTCEGDEVILDFLSHIYFHELSAISIISRVLPKPLNYDNGSPDIFEIENNISISGQFSWKTSLICLENTHNHRGGSIVPLELFKKLRKLSNKYQAKIHLDGARIFNASVASGTPVSEFAKYVNSLMFCLSKGLSAPVGSMLCGPSDFIEQARKWRRLLGGSMRQAGVIAAAGIVALSSMRDRLHEDHSRAKILAKELAELPGICLDPSKIMTNIVIFKFEHPQMSTEQFLQELQKKEILALAMSSNEIRFVTHKDISDIDIEKTIRACKRILV